MPELPEVEVARQNLLRWLKGRRVVRAEALGPPRTFRGSSAARFEALRGKLLKAERKGKYLMLHFERDQGLMAHLGMTGKFVRRKEDQPLPYSRARLVLDNGTAVHFRDPRLFGRLEPVAASQLHALAPVAALGPDALNEERSGPTLADSLGRSRQDLKVALMNQGLISGLGNIHAAEALFRAKLHPSRKPASLSKEEWARLARGIQSALQFALKETAAEEVRYVEEGPEVDNPFKVYGKRDEPCSICRSPIRSFAQGGRTTYYCPRCQPPARAVRARRKRSGR